MVEILRDPPLVRNSLVVVDIASELVLGELKVAYVGTFGTIRFFQMDASSWLVMAVTVESL